MAADLHIHVFKGVSEETLAKFFSNTLGSKYFSPTPVTVDKEDAFTEISTTPNVWIGEVSWLKAAVLGCSEDFVPGPVQAISNLIGEDMPSLDDALADKIMAALTIKNNTGYSIADPEHVRVFLEQHKGERLFTVSW